jgi:hypothetical protein
VRDFGTSSSEMKLRTSAREADAFISAAVAATAAAVSALSSHTISSTLRHFAKLRLTSVKSLPLQRPALPAEHLPLLADLR